MKPARAGDDDQRCSVSVRQRESGLRVPLSANSYLPQGAYRLAFVAE